MHYKWKTPQDMLQSRSKIDSNDCWIWQGATNSKGYGSIGNTGWAKKFNTYSTHRLSYKVFNGEIPENMLVCHTCNVPSCVNPKHLYVGTNEDNIRDRIIAGSSKGERNPNSKLTVNNVLEIKKLLARFTNVQIAAKFNVDARCISDIRVGRTWRYL